MLQARAQAGCWHLKPSALCRTTVELEAFDDDIKRAFFLHRMCPLPEHLLWRTGGSQIPIRANTRTGNWWKFRAGPSLSPWQHTFFGDIERKQTNGPPCCQSEEGLWTLITLWTRK